MLVVFSPIFLAGTKIIFWYDFVAPLIFLKGKKKKILLIKKTCMKTSDCQWDAVKEETLNCVFLWKVNSNCFIMCQTATAGYLLSPKWPEFSKNPKKTSPRILNQLHQFALANVLAQFVMKLDFRSLKQQLRMVEIFYFSCIQCRESNVIYKKGQNVVFSKTIPASLLSPYNHRERVKHLILFPINVNHFCYRQRPKNCSEYFFQMPSRWLRNFEQEIIHSVLATFTLILGTLNYV